MAKKYLIDTSGVIKYLNQTFAEPTLDFIDGIVDSECAISFVTEIELQVWNPTSATDLVIYKQFVENAEIAGVTQEIINRTIEVRKQSGIKLADAIIAATAIINSQTLIADNDKDFLKVKGLSYLNPKNEKFSSGTV